MRQEYSRGQSSLGTGGGPGDSDHEVSTRAACPATWRPEQGEGRAGVCRPGEGSGETEGEGGKAGESRRGSKAERETERGRDGRERGKRQRWRDRERQGQRGETQRWRDRDGEGDTEKERQGEGKTGRKTDGERQAQTWSWHPWGCKGRRGPEPCMSLAWPTLGIQQGGDEVCPEPLGPATGGRPGGNATPGVCSHSPWGVPFLSLTKSQLW